MLSIYVVASSTERKEEYASLPAILNLACACSGVPMSKEKNAQIKATLLATKERRKTQKCFVFSTKIDYNTLSKLNKLQKEQES